MTFEMQNFLFSEFNDSPLGCARLLLGSFDLERSWTEAESLQESFDVEHVRKEHKRAVWFGIMTGLLNAAEDVAAHWQPEDEEESLERDHVAYQIALRSKWLNEWGVEWGLVHKRRAADKHVDYLTPNQQEVFKGN